MNCSQEKFAQRMAGALLLVGMGTAPICSANFALTPYIGDSERARAGGAAAAEDATTAFTNPAGLTRLTGSQVLFAAQYYLPSTRFTDQGSIDASGAPLSGGDGGNPGSNTFIPNFYYSHALSDSWSMGLVLNVPFGLSTRWDRDWVGRYQAVESSITSVNINPTIGFKINKEWAVGAGISFVHTDAKLSSAIDYGAVCFALANPATCTGLSLTPQRADGFIEQSGSDWGTGFNVGIIRNWDRVRAGISYRSRIHHTLKGNTDFTNPPQAAAFAPAFTNTHVELPLVLPDILSASIYYNWSPALAVMADITVTGWSSINQLTFRYENPAQATTVIAKDWKDTTRIAFGFDYRLNPAWRLQGGVAHEQSAIPTKTLDPSVPINNAYWISAGVLYSFSEKYRLGFGLNHIIFDNRDMNIKGPMGDTLHGNIAPSLDVISTHFEWNY